jgi:predicted PurR-regulated permease PerM
MMGRTSTLVGAASAAVLAIALKQLHTVLLPFAFALFFFYLADPLVDRLARWKVPRLAGIALVLLAAAALLAGALGMTFRAAAKLAENKPRYERKLEQSLGEKRAASVRQRLAKMKESSGSGAASGVTEAAGAVLLIFAYAAFLLSESPRARQRWKRAFPRKADSIVKVLDVVQERMVRFIRLQVAVSAGTATVFWLILVAYGVELAAFWSLLNFISQFVPNIGPIVSSLPPVLTVLVDDDPSKAAAVGGWLLASQFLIGNFVEPKILGHGTRLDPISVLLGIVFFGWMWGIMGSLLAVPILVFVKTVCENVPSLHPVAGLLQGTETEKS